MDCIDLPDPFGPSILVIKSLKKIPSSQSQYYKKRKFRLQASKDYIEAKHFADINKGSTAVVV